MKWSLRRSWIVLTALVLLLGIAAGCSSGNKSGTANSGAPSGSGAAESSSPPKDKVKITFWHVWAENNSDFIKNRVKEFNEMQDAIEVTALGDADETKQLTALAGGNSPDIALTFWNNVGPWADRGAIMPLDDFIARDKYDTGAFIPAAMDRMSVNGKVYALPYTMSMANTLLYNKQMLADAGVEAPPATLEEMFEIAKKVTKKDANGDITAAGFIPNYPWVDNVFWPIVFGGSFVDEQGNVTPDKPENIEAIAYQVKYMQEFGVDRLLKFQTGMGAMSSDQDPIVTGKLAMMIGWDWMHPDKIGEGKPLGVAEFPYPAGRPDLKGSGIAAPRSVFIPKNSPHPEEAWTFMKWLLGVDSQVAVSLEASLVPAIKAALDDPRLTEAEAYAPLRHYLERAKSENLNGFPNSVYINEYLGALGEETDKALKGAQTPEEAMAKVKEKIQKLADKQK